MPYDTFGVLTAFGFAPKSATLVRLQGLTYSKWLRVSGLGSLGYPGHCNPSRFLGRRRAWPARGTRPDLCRVSVNVSLGSRVLS